MKRKPLLFLLALAALALGLVFTFTSSAVLASPVFRGHYYFDFEKSLAPWTPSGNDSAVSSLVLANGDGCAASSGSTSGGHHAVLGSNTVTVASEAIEKRGAWIVATFPSYQEEYVGVDFMARNEFKAATDAPTCTTCSPMAYIGPDQPLIGDQFTSLKDQGALSAKWQHYHYGLVTDIQANGKTYIAIGTDRVPANLGIDCIDVQILPVVP